MREFTPGEIGMAIIFIVALVVVAGFMLLGCTHEAERSPCTDAELAAIVADCRALEEDAGCAGDPETRCPKIVAECDKKIDSWKVCK